MKFGKTVGLSLLYLGILLILFGLIAAILPLQENEQIRLILVSFEAPTSNAALGLINQLFLDMIRYHLELCIIGGGMALLGIALLFIFKGVAKKLPPAKGAHKGIAVSSPGRPAAPYAKPPADPARMASLPASPLDAWTNGILSPTHFSAPALRRESPKAPTTDSSAQELNPYLSYGQSAYAPPAKPGKPPIAESPVETATKSMYQRPSSLKKAANSGDAVLDTEQSDSEQEDSLQAPVTFHVPSLHIKPLAKASPIQPMEASVAPCDSQATEDKGSSMPGDKPPIRIRSTVTTFGKRAAPSFPAQDDGSLKMDFSLQKELETEPLASEKPQFTSKRIRSTVGRSAQ